MMASLAGEFKDTPEKCLKSLYLPPLNQEDSENLPETNSKIQETEEEGKETVEE